MRADELWVECYQGEVLGETLFRLLAERQPDPTRRHQLDVLATLERATKELAEPMFEARSIDRGDTAATVATATAMAELVAGLAWEEYLASFEPVTTEFLAKYRELVTLATDEGERQIAASSIITGQTVRPRSRRSTR